MPTGKEPEPCIRTTRASEIFRDPPGSGNYSSSIGAAQGSNCLAAVASATRPPAKRFLSQPAKFQFSQRLTCWWSAAARPERPPLSLRRGLAPTYCWLSATTTWAGFRPAGLSSGSTA